MSQNDLVLSHSDSSPVLAQSPSRARILSWVGRSRSSEKSSIPANLISTLKSCSRASSSTPPSTLSKSPMKAWFRWVTPSFRIVAFLHILIPVRPSVHLKLLSASQVAVYGGDCESFGTCEDTRIGFHVPVLSYRIFWRGSSSESVKKHGWEALHWGTDKMNKAHLGLISISLFCCLIWKIKKTNESPCKDGKNGVKQLKISQVVKIHKSVKDNYVIWFICPSL